MAESANKKTTELITLSDPQPEDSIMVVDDDQVNVLNNAELGFGTFLKTYNRSAAEAAVPLSNDDLDFREDEGHILRYGENGDPGTTDTTTAIVNADAVMAANGGTIRASNQVFAFSGKINISQAVNLVGDGNSNIAGEGTEFKCLNAAAQIAFGVTGSGQRGGISGNFKINGNSVATQPFFIGLSVHRMFESIDINDAVGACWVIEEAQNCVFISINTFKGSESLVLDKGCGNNAFFRLNLSDPTNYCITIKETTGTGPFTIPTKNMFYSGLAERSVNGEGLDYQSGIDNIFDNFEFSCLTPSSAASLIKVATAGQRLRMHNPYFTGNQTHTSCFEVAASGSVLLTGRMRANAFLNLFNIAVGAEIDVEDYTSTAVTNIFAGAGNQNTVIRSRIRTPKQFFRNAAGDNILLAGTFADVGFRFGIDTNGKLGWDDGTGFTFDTNLFRNAANQLKTDDAFACDTILTKSTTEVVTATNVITAAESGTTFFLNIAGGFTSTLPAAATGLKYKFIVSTAPTTAYIITTNSSANILFGTFLDIVGELVYFSAQDTLNFVASTSVVGDFLEVESDGTNWYCTAKSGADGGITVAVT